MKKLTAILTSICLMFEFLSVPIQCLTYDEAISHLEEMEQGLGIEKGSVEVVPCDYDDVLAWGYDPLRVVGWTPVDDGERIYINKWYIGNADYTWTIAHELTHIKQIREGRLILSNQDYYKEESYDSLWFEQEAESIAQYYFFYFNFGYLPAL